MARSGGNEVAEVGRPEDMGSYYLQAESGPQSICVHPTNKNVFTACVCLAHNYKG